MRNLFLILFFINFVVALYAQENLVYNGSFEEYCKCPGSYNSDIFACEGWWSPNDATPDYYHKCMDNHTNSYYYYKSHYEPKTGNGYIGLALIGVKYFWMEHIQSQLLEPLEAGKRYKVSFWVRLAYKYSDYATYNIGLYFSKDSIIFKNQYELSFQHKYYKIMEQEHTAHVSNPKGNYIKDTNWVEISGIYTAKGGEQYITIGMFWDDNPKVIKALDEVQNTGDFKKFGKVVASNTFIRNKYMEKKYKNADAKGEQHFPYYLIDDVSVVKLEE